MYILFFSSFYSSFNILVKISSQFIKTNKSIKSSSESIVTFYFFFFSELDFTVEKLSFELMYSAKRKSNFIFRSIFVVVIPPHYYTFCVDIPKPVCKSTSVGMYKSISTCHKIISPIKKYKTQDTRNMKWVTNCITWYKLIKFVSLYFSSFWNNLQFSRNETDSIMCRNRLHLNSISYVFII